ncbi:hypothetical protein CERZMDRAFT_98079 [Cercospora zeae-maydis SCOH1-5]|uniref:Uncharacterized protein n=1 Tax=Cercospora zeae-maydis SCOH1-5 TaxID=717836 RepID=A0A6A6FE26_9PEZI|nr:hypothetical protein CERZMDRAFT_98079 [Cercospora zeae-maydis SCOH1-5]
MPFTQSDIQIAIEALVKLYRSTSPPPQGDPFHWTPTTDRILLFFCAQRKITPADYGAIVQCIREFHGTAPSYDQIRQRVRDFQYEARLRRGEPTLTVKLKLW